MALVNILFSMIRAASLQFSVGFTPCSWGVYGREKRVFLEEKNQIVRVWFPRDKGFGMVNQDHSNERRLVALLAAACTLGSLAVAPAANAATTPVTADKAQTTTSQTTEAGNTSDKADATADKTTGTGETGSAGNATAGDANNGNTAADGTNQNDAAATDVATVTSADGTTVTPYDSFRKALDAVKTGETVTLTTSTSENVDVAQGVENYTVTAAEGAVYSGTMTAHGAVTITGMTFSLDGTNGTTTSVSIQGAGGVVVKNNTFSVAENADQNQSYNGVVLAQGSARATIDGNTFNFSVPQKSKERRAVNIQGNPTISTVSITNNKLNVTGAASLNGMVMLLSAFGNTASGYGVTNLTVTGNTVTADAESKGSAYGAYVQGVQNMTFTGNSFTNLRQALGSGVATGQNTKSDKVTVGDNTFKGTTFGYNLGNGVTDDGLTFSKPDNGNTNNPGIAAGVVGENGVITPYATFDAAVKAAKDGDIVQLLSNVTLDNFVTINKKIVLDGQGYTLNGQIRLSEKASGSTIQNVRFMLNSVSKMSGWSANVYISSASNVKITNNTFTMTGNSSMISGKAMGIFVFPNQNTKIDSTTITNNKFDIDATGKSYNVGIHLSNEINTNVPGITNTVISGNTMVGHQGAAKEGVFLVAYDKSNKLGVDGLTISGNKLAEGGSATGGTLVDFWGGAKDITISDNIFGAGEKGVQFGAKNWGGQSAQQENVDIKGNTFNTKYGVVDDGGLKKNTEFKYDEYVGTENANKFGNNTLPFVGTSSTGTESYGVVYREKDGALIGWESVAKDGLVQNAPSKSGYTVTWYKDGDIRQPFDPVKDKVTGNLTLIAQWTSNGGSSNGGTVAYPSSPVIVSKPNKLEYRIGEQFDATGMVVRYQGSILGFDQYTVTLDTSKPGKIRAFVTLNSDPSKATSFEVTVVVSDIKVHRLYNPRSGEHFYVSSENEYNALIKSGQWRDEGIGFTMADYGTPVYRLYNPGGKHLFTTSVKERDVLIRAKWNYEGVAFYVPESSDGSGDSATKVHRLYNPGNGDHLLTTSANERGVLVMHGWRDEGTAFTAK
ncbi:hypothetical protein COO72_11810 [Bifidobacterium callitrichos]|nr:hypothetical protein COO72_11810 [Bifidobacterium callitrichos]